VIHFAGSTCCAVRRLGDPLIEHWLVIARKRKDNMSLIEQADDKHSAEHRSASVNMTEAGGEGAYSPARGAPLPALDTRSDRRKYLVPDQHIDTVINACRSGVSEVRIARSLGVNYRTWMRVRAEDERVASALSESRKFEEDELVSLLMDKARGGETTAIIFALKGRHGYRDHGTPPASAAEARVNVTINLPAASASIADYVRVIDAEPSA
jgi:hypothetical protein